MLIKLKRAYDHTLPIPVRSTEGSAAFDLCCVDSWRIDPVREKTGVLPVLVRTGWSWEIPQSHCGLVLPRSGLTLRKNLSVANAPGLIDSDCRGEVGVLLINHSHEPVTLNHGDRIAQMLIVPVAWNAHVKAAVELSETDRGEGGFGSTEVKLPEDAGLAE